MKKITNTQKYAILWLHSKNLNNKDIAKELKINETEINNILLSNTQSASQPVNSAVKNLMITESVAQKHKVAVMTKAASELGDHDRTKLVIDNTNKNFIYKPGSQKNE